MSPAGWDRTTVRALEPPLSPDSLKGRTIGLCDEKLKAMSGEEVEGMEQGTLAARVRQVGSPRGQTGQRWRASPPPMSTDGALAPFQVSIFFRTSPKHKVKIIKVSGLNDTGCPG